MPAKHILVKGKVQGVFYRATAKETAEGLGLTGWVKNTEAGAVEIVASGTEEQLSRFVSWCRQGPPAAVVADVLISDTEEKVFEKFTVIRG